MVKFYQFYRVKNITYGGNDDMKDIRKMAEENLDYMIKLRRDFHMYPELSFKEFRTADKISEELTKMNIEHKRVTDTGIVAQIKGSQPGKTVALRADIDALEIIEKTGLDYSSKNEGIMHACGHDVHTASLLGAAKIINEMKNELNGTVKLIFQPGEETVTGAPKMIKADNFMDDVNAVFAIHNVPDLDCGNVYVREGGMMFAGEGFTIRVKGVGGHGATPHLAKDALLAASHIVVAIQNIIPTEIDSRDVGVITIGEAKAGTRFNIIADYAEMKGTYRCYTKEVENIIKAAMTRIVENTAKACGLEASIEFSMYVPPVTNDETIGKIVRASAAKIIKGNEKVENHPGATGSDDFAYFLEKAPGYYAFVGSGVSDKSKRASVHSSNMVVDEKHMEVIASLHAQFALDFLQQ